jgi:hypothetical protein
MHRDSLVSLLLRAID